MMWTELGKLLIAHGAGNDDNLYVGISFFIFGDTFGHLTTFQPYLKTYSIQHSTSTKSKICFRPRTHLASPPGHFFRGDEDPFIFVRII